MVVVEAAARGTPSIVVAGEDNAAVELIEEGVNGFVVASADAQDDRRRDRRGARRGHGATREHGGLVCRQRRATVAGGLAADGARQLRTPRQRAGVAVERQLRGAPPGELLRSSKPTRTRYAPARRRLGRAMRRSPPRSRARSCGSNSSAASPATSGSEEAFEHATGTPRAIASSTGSPKPSYSDGYTNARRNCPQTLELLGPTPSPESARRRRHRGSPHARAAPARATSGSPGSTSSGRRSGGISASAAISPSRFLCGRLADRLSTTSRSPRSNRARVSRLWQRRRAPHGPEPSGTTSIRSGRCPAARSGRRACSAEIAITRSSGARPTAPAAHPLVADPSVRLGKRA